MPSMDERLEQIGRDASAARELGEGTVAVLGEILGVLRGIQADLRGMAEFQFEALQDLRDLGRSHSEGIMQILDRLGPGPGGAPA